VRKNHTPVLIKRLQHKLNSAYIRYKVRPQFDSLGHSPSILNPHTLELTGENIHGGDYLHIISNRARPVSLTSWRSKQNAGEISLGDYCLISPGVNIASATNIHIGANTMLAAEVVISDCDWHGRYNRIRPFRCSNEVIIGENVWLGLRSIVGKGVQIGNNSIIGAGSVVVNDIPANVIAAGNPAVVVKHLNPKRRMLKRDFLFQGKQDYWQSQQTLDETFSETSYYNWLKVSLFPNKED